MIHDYKNTLPSLPPIDQTVNEKETKSVLLLYLKYQQTAHEPAETVLESVMSTKAAMRERLQFTDYQSSIIRRNIDFDCQLSNYVLNALRLTRRTHTTENTTSRQKEQE